MKMSKHAWEAWWEKYMQAIRAFRITGTCWWKHVPVKRIEISIDDD